MVSFILTLESNLGIILKSTLFFLAKTSIFYNGNEIIDKFFVETRIYVVKSNRDLGVSSRSNINFKSCTEIILFLKVQKKSQKKIAGFGEGHFMVIFTPTYGLNLEFISFPLNFFKAR